MSDDESARPAADPNPAGTAPVPTPAPTNAGPTAAEPATEPGTEPATGEPRTGQPTTSEAATAEAATTETASAATPSEPVASEPAASDAGVLPAGDTAVLPAAPVPGPAEPVQPAAEPAPVPAKNPSKAVAFLKTHAVTLVLAVLLVGAIVWGALGLASANDWESRATSLSSDLSSVEQSLADAKATIDDLETAKSRAESTATACIGAIDDADAMLEVSAKIDEKTVVYLDGLNDLMTAINAGNVSAAESIATEIDKLSVQIEDLSEQVDGHIENYADSAEGCHVDDAQGV